MATVAPIELIALDDRGRAFVRGTAVRVSQIARDVVGGMSASDIHAAYPELSLGRVHAALAYYYEHVDEIRAQIVAEDRADEASRRRHSARSHTRGTLLRRATDDRG